MVLFGPPGHLQAPSACSLPSGSPKLPKLLTTHCGHSVGYLSWGKYSPGRAPSDPGRSSPSPGASPGPLARRRGRPVPVAFKARPFAVGRRQFGRRIGRGPDDRRRVDRNVGARRAPTKTTPEPRGPGVDSDPAIGSPLGRRLLDLDDLAEGHRSARPTSRVDP